MKAMDFSTGEGESVKGVRAGMRSDDGKVDSIERKKDNRNRNKNRKPTITKQTKNP
jgi:hypothetical protein